MFKTVTLLSLVLAAITIAPRAHAQDPAALSTGTLTTNGGTFACDTSKGYLSGMTCQDATVTCPNIDAITLTFGYIGPANPQGTVVFLTGGTGEKPIDPSGDTGQYANTYKNYFEVIYLGWDSPWEEPNQTSNPSNPGGNILQAACRPATFLKYIDIPEIH